MHLPSLPVNTLPPGWPYPLVARLLLVLSPAKAQEHEQIVELDRDLLLAACQASARLAREGWAIALSSDGPHVELIALKHTIAIQPTLMELARLGITAGELYFDALEKSTTTHHVDLRCPERVTEIDPNTQQASDHRAGGLDHERAGPMDPMAEIELTFRLEISEESLEDLRERQDEGEFGVTNALALIVDARPSVTLTHVADENR